MSAASAARAQSETAVGPLWLGYSLALAIMCLWTGWIIVSRHGVQQTLTLYDITALRWGVGGLLVLPFVLRWGLAGLKWSRAALLIIFFGPPYALVIYTAFLYAPAAHAGVLVNGLLPFITLVLGAILLGERATRSRLFGVALVLVGSLFMAGDGLLLAPPGTWIGDLLFVVTAVMLASYMVAARVWGVTQRQALASVLAGGMLAYLPLFLLLPLPSTLKSLPVEAWPWAEVLLQGGYQGILVSIGGVMGFTLATRILGAPTMAAFMAAVPAVTLLVAWPLLGEVPSVLAIAGVVVVTGGILFASGLLPRRRG
ncbi:MAG: DMT family transporter [Pseudomonadota bacterium]